MGKLLNLMKESTNAADESDLYRLDEALGKAKPYETTVERRSPNEMNFVFQDETEKQYRLQFYLAAGIGDKVRRINIGEHISGRNYRLPHAKFDDTQRVMATVVASMTAFIKTPDGKATTGFAIALPSVLGTRPSRMLRTFLLKSPKLKSKLAVLEDSVAISKDVNFIWCTRKNANPEEVFNGPSVAGLFGEDEDAPTNPMLQLVNQYFSESVYELSEDESEIEIELTNTLLYRSQLSADAQGQFETANQTIKSNAKFSDDIHALGVNSELFFDTVEAIVDNPKLETHSVSGEEIYFSYEGDEYLLSGSDSDEELKKNGDVLPHVDFKALASDPIATLSNFSLSVPNAIALDVQEANIISGDSVEIKCTNDLSWIVTPDIESFEAYASWEINGNFVKSDLKIAKEVNYFKDNGISGTYFKAVDAVMYSELSSGFQALSVAALQFKANGYNWMLTNNNGDAGKLMFGKEEVEDFDVAKFMEDPAKYIYGPTQEDVEPNVPAAPAQKQGEKEPAQPELKIVNLMKDGSMDFRYYSDEVDDPEMKGVINYGPYSIDSNMPIKSDLQNIDADQYSKFFEVEAAVLDNWGDEVGSISTSHIFFSPSTGHTVELSRFTTSMVSAMIDGVQHDFDQDAFLADPTGYIAGLVELVGTAAKEQKAKVVDAIAYAVAQDKAGYTNRGAANEPEAGDLEPPKKVVSLFGNQPEDGGVEDDELADLKAITIALGKNGSVFSYTQARLNAGANGFYIGSHGMTFDSSLGSLEGEVTILNSASEGYKAVLDAVLGYLSTSIDDINAKYVALDIDGHSITLQGDGEGTFAVYVDNQASGKLDNEMFAEDPSGYLYNEFGIEADVDMDEPDSAETPYGTVSSIRCGSGTQFKYVEEHVTESLSNGMWINGDKEVESGMSLGAEIHLLQMQLDQNNIRLLGRMFADIPESDIYYFSAGLQDFKYRGLEIVHEASNLGQIDIDHVMYHFSEYQAQDNFLKELDNIIDKYVGTKAQGNEYEGPVEKTLSDEELKAKLTAEYPYLTPLDSKYSQVEANKNVRAKLKHDFPGIKFSVKKGGSYGFTDVEWTDGPNRNKVKESLKYWGGGHMDMTDYWSSPTSDFERVFGDLDSVGFYHNHTDDAVQAAIDKLAEYYGSSPEDIITVEDYRKGAPQARNKTPYGEDSVGFLDSWNGRINQALEDEFDFED